MASKPVVNRLRRLSLAALPALLCGAFATNASASDKWPDRPIRLIVNFAPAVPPM